MNDRDRFDIFFTSLMSLQCHPKNQFFKLSFSEQELIIKQCRALAISMCEVSEDLFKERVV